MKVSLESIKKLTKIKISNDELISKVFTQIAAVENIENLEEKYKGILIGEIVEKKDHPDSDKLGVFQVKIGKETVQVVAGDRSLEVGSKVAYFTPGSKVPYNPHPEKNENVVQKAILRGVESNGMLASSRELDLGTDHTKVMRLDANLKVGQTFIETYNLNDIVLDIENKSLANRADCFGIIGIAREISAIQGLEFISPDWYKQPKKDLKTTKELLTLNVQNNSEVNCPRYMAVTISDVVIKDSPIWMQIELAKAGIKPINNVVDITNYVMILTSQPMHAFDYNKVVSRDPHSNKTAFITIRQAKNGEKILGINNHLMELDDSMAVVCDSEKPILVAGVMGGNDTEIDQNTKTLILECANYNRYNSRKTSWKLGVFTEAVTRYTKHQDPNQCEKALYYAISLLEGFANATVSSEIIDNYPDPIKPKTIYIEKEKLLTATGLNISTKEIKDILTNIEFEVEEVKEDQLKIVVPTIRQDVNIAQDIYEDVGRIYGYNSIPVTLPTKSILPAKTNDFVDLKDKIRQILASQGANELLTYNFISAKMLADYNEEIENAYHLVNALSPELEYMRISLLPSLFEKMKENIGRGYTQQALFEINLGHNKKEIDENNLPVERWTLAFVTVKNKETESSPYYDSKVYLDTLIQRFKIKDVKFELISQVTPKDIPFWISQRIPMFNPNRSAVVSVFRENKKFYLGIIGEISNAVKNNASLPNTVSAFEIDLHELKLSISKISNYQEPSKYPKVVQDLCFSMDKDIPYASIVSEIESVLISTHLYTSLTLIDIYINPKTPDLKQMTFRISIQSKDKTLENMEFEKVKNKLVYMLNQKFKTTLI